MAATVFDFLVAAVMEIMSGSSPSAVISRTQMFLSLMSIAASCRALEEERMNGYYFPISIHGRRYLENIHAQRLPQSPYIR